MASKPELSDDGVMVFRPSMKEFRDFEAYVTYMESCGAHKYGIAKVIPPKEWSPKADLESIDDMVIPTPISQLVTGRGGLFHLINMARKPLTVQKHRELAQSKQYAPPKASNFEELERKYWKNLSFNQPIYGADVSGSLTHPSVKCWNIDCLPSILDELTRCGVSIPGVNTAYLYFGMWKTSFAWHTEDMDLYSINYLHHGDPKAWYAIPPEHGKRLEGLAKGFFPVSHQTCNSFLRHKTSIISPSVLKKYSIPFRRMLQREGEFMITFPYGYHAGFNCGYNIAESTNFALERWIEFGERATRCYCRSDTVKIDMELFGSTMKNRQGPKSQWPQYAGRMRSGATRVTGEGEDDDSIGRSPGKRVALTGGKKKTVPSSERATAPRKTKRQVTEGEGEEEEDLSMPEKKKVKREPGAAKATLATSSKAIESTGTTAKRKKTGGGQSKSPAHLGSPVHASSPDSPSASKLCKDSSLSRAPVTPPLQHHDIASSGQVEFSFSNVDDIIGLWQHQPKNFPVEVAWNTHLSKADTCCAVCSRIELADNGAGVPDYMMKYLKQLNVSEPPVLPATVGEESSAELLCTGEVRGVAIAPAALPAAHGQDCEHPSIPTILSDSSVHSSASHSSVCGDHDYAKLTIPEDMPESTQPGRGAASSSSELVTMQDGNCQLGVADVSAGKPLLPDTPESHASMSGSVLPDLLTCQACRICVHPACYGVTEVSGSLSDWLCSRCQEEAQSQDCCLCAMRGGALKKTDDGRWAHVVCAVCIPEVMFGDLASRQPICLSGVPAGRWKLKCQYCQSCGRQRLSGACIQCSHGKCNRPLHITCAGRPGVRILQGDWPQVLRAECHRHEHVEKTGAVRAVDFAVGEVVIAKHKNCRFYKAVVQDIVLQTYYEILFDDCTYSDNMLPEDIMNRNCTELGPPEEGDSVQVMWTDGDAYGGKFMRTRCVVQYTVLFEDQSTRLLPKEHVFSRAEKLPKKVQAKLSVSDDERESPKALPMMALPLPVAGKRQRRPCTRLAL